MQLKEELAGLQKPPVVAALHPPLVDRYLAAIGQLETTIQYGLPAGGEGAKALRELVDTVVI